MLNHFDSDYTNDFVADMTYFSIIIEMRSSLFMRLIFCHLNNLNDANNLHITLEDTWIFTELFVVMLKSVGR